MLISQDNDSIGMKSMKGGCYKGEIDGNGKACGEGTFKLPSGETYEGTFYSNKFHGYGIYTDTEGRREGEWKEGKRNGKQTKYYNGNGWISNRIYELDKCT